MDVETLFLHFVASREPAHLAAVFDLVADDLYRVALHVARDAAEADDLLQATFLIAIERASGFERGRPLRPWLLGILHREAKGRRRRARRAPDPLRLPPRETEAPERLVLAAEARSEVSAAIARLPQPYREVLELRFVHALEAGEIATRLGRSPGAVRTQLWRGLERLRGLLPRGLALGGAAALAHGSALAAVRERVLAAAAERAAPAPVGEALAIPMATGALAGALLVKKLAFAVAAALAAVLVVVGWNGPPVAAPPQAPAPMGAPAVNAARSGTREHADDPAEGSRLAIAPPPGPAADLATPAPPASLPVRMRALVVDAVGDPVPDAKIVAYAPLVRRNAAGELETRRARATGPPLWRARSDASGRCSFSFAGECYVSARKDGVGMSGDVRVSGHPRFLVEDWRLVLLPIVRVRGTIRLADGSPAAGVEIRRHHTTSLYGDLASDWPPVRADDAGNFAFDALPQLDLRLMARSGDRYCRAYLETGSTAREHEVAMQFPGAFSVRGRLLDASGNGIAGDLRLVATSAPPQGPRWQRIEARDDGTFAELRTEGGSFWLVGVATGHSAAWTQVLLDSAQPHAAVSLQLPPLATLAGRVVDGDGRPRPNVFLWPSFEVGEDPIRRARMGLSTSLERGPCGADGTFRWQVPAGLPIRITARTTEHRYVRGPLVEAPADDVRIVLEDADMVDPPGLVLAVRARVAATGQPVGQFEVRIRGRDAAGGTVLDQFHRSVDGGFESGPLPPGCRYEVVVSAAGHPPCTLGPVDGAVRREELLAQFGPFGSVACRVLRADGTPAAFAFVSLWRGIDDRDYQGETDRDGRILLTDVDPDDYTLHAFTSRAAFAANRASTPIRVLPGQETATVVTLER